MVKKGPNLDSTGVGSFFFPRYELTTNFRIPIHGERQCNKSVIQAIDFSLPVRHLIFAKDVNRCRSSWREPAPREGNFALALAILQRKKNIADERNIFWKVYFKRFLFAASWLTIAGRKVYPTWHASHMVCTELMPMFFIWNCYTPLPVDSD